MTETEYADIDVEKMTVSTMIGEPHSIDIAYDIIGNDLQFFVSDVCRLLYRTILDVWSKENVGPTTVWAALKQEERNRIGSLEGFCDFTLTGFGADTKGENMQYYCNILKHHALQREYYRTIRRQLAKLQDNFQGKQFDTAELISSIESSVLNVSAGNDGLLLLENSNDVLMTIEEDIIKMTNDQMPKPIVSGYPEFDNIIYGFRPTHTYIISGAPGCGKSSFVHNIANNILEQGVPVCYISYEMDRQLVLARMISTLTGIPVKALMPEEKISTEHWSAFQEHRTKLTDQPLIIIDDGPSLEKLGAICKRLHRKFGLFIIIVDYVQLISIANRPELSEYQRVSECSRVLKGIATRDNIPIIIVSQLSREGKLRGSGYLDQDASLIARIEKEVTYDTGMVLHKSISMKIPKNRMGPGGIELQYKFYGSTLKFEEVPP